MQPLLPWKRSKYYNSECVFVALLTQHSRHMRHIILSSVVSLAVPYFPAFSHRRFSKEKNKKKKVTKYKIYVFSYLQLLCEIQLNLGLCDTSSITLHILWYDVILLKAPVFLPCLVRHTQQHPPRVLEIRSH